MNSKDRVLGLLQPRTSPGPVPAAFFIHFGDEFRHGQAAIDKHLEFHDYTGMDIVKVQYEDRFPFCPEIREPADWAGLPARGLDFYDNQLEILAGIIKAASSDALVIQTMYSPFMQACTTAGRDRLRAHIEADPGAVNHGMQTITESMLAYVKECIALGVDGFYASTQGGDLSMFADSPRFEECIKPHDLTLMEEMDRACRFNILHICDFHSAYRDLTPFEDYPGHVVSIPGTLEYTGMQASQGFGRFGRPMMGGLDRHGAIARGAQADIVAAVHQVLDAAPGNIFLGADCTLPADVSWDNIRTAIEAAHAWRG